MHIDFVIWVHQGELQSEFFERLGAICKILEHQNVMYEICDNRIPPDWLEFDGKAFKGKQVKFSTSAFSHEELVWHRQLFEELMTSGATAISTNLTLIPDTPEQIAACLKKTPAKPILALPHDGDLTQFTLEELGISNRVRTCLQRGGIKNVAETIKRPGFQLLAIPNFGKGALKELEKALAKYDLELVKTNEAMIELLMLPVRQYTLLNRAGFRTIGELTSIPPSALLARTELREQDIEIIERALQKIGCEFAEEITNH